MIDLINTLRGISMKRIIIQVVIVIVTIVLALLMSKWIWSWDIPEWLKILLIAN